MGNTEPKDRIVGPTDSPVAALESIRMLLFSGDIGDDRESIAVCDAVNAFRQSKDYEADLPARYVGYKSHKHGKLSDAAGFFMCPGFGLLCVAWLLQPHAPSWLRLRPPPPGEAMTRSLSTR